MPASPASDTPVGHAPYRPYSVRVRRAVRLSPHFVRLTLTGEELAHFGTAGLDQRIKLLLPHPDGTFADIGQDEASGDWYDRWRALPTPVRNPFRTYTVRRIAPDDRELDVDVVVHPHPGPAGAWAERAAAGDPVIVIGPDQRSATPALGIDWHPGTARRMLLAGDETAAPAIGGILDALRGADPDGRAVDVDAFVEVPTDADILRWPTGPSLRVHWLARNGRPHGERLIGAVRDWVAASGDVIARAAAPRLQQVADVDIDRELLWDSPEEAADGEFYAWMAGEAATVKTLRRLLVTEHGVDRRRVAFMGYWRAGQAERIG